MISAAKHEVSEALVASLQSAVESLEGSDAAVGKDYIATAKKVSCHSAFWFWLAPGAIESTLQKLTFPLLFFFFYQVLSKGGAAYVSKELKRLEGIIAGKNILPEKKSAFQLRRNLLAAFQGPAV